MHSRGSTVTSVRALRSQPVPWLALSPCRRHCVSSIAIQAVGGGECGLIGLLRFALADVAFLHAHRRV